MELPSAIPITREAFSTDPFKVDEFLYQYHKYQTLEDLQKQLRHWKQVLEVELIDVINQDYGEFVGLGKSLSGGESKVQDVKMEVLSFERQVVKVQANLNKNGSDISQLIAQKQKLITMQNHVKKLIIYSKRLTDLELWVDQSSKKGLAVSGKSVEEMAKSFLILKKYPSCPFIEKQSDRVHSVQAYLVRQLREQLRHLAAKDGDEALKVAVLLEMC